MNIDENVIGEIHNVIKKAISSGKPVRIFFNEYVRKKKFNSKSRKIISDFFFNAVRYYGIFEKEPLRFEKKLKDILTVNIDEYEFLTEICKFEKKIAFHIIESLKNYNFSKYFLNRAPLTIRVNNLLNSRDKLFNDLLGKHNIIKTELSPHGLIFKDNINVRSLNEFKKGYFEIQDEASQLSTLIAPIIPNMKVLDYCAGTGGKSLALYSHFYGNLEINVNDISQTRLNTLFKRAKVLNYKIKKFLPDKKYDFILIDAPCSGLGSIRRDVDLNLRTNFSNLVQTVKIQREIFEKAVKSLKKGGYILYITCSFLEFENENQIDLFLKEHPDLNLIKLSDVTDKHYSCLINDNGFFKTGPWINNMDSFFAALLKAE